MSSAPKKIIASQNRTSLCILGSSWIIVEFWSVM